MRIVLLHVPPWKISSAEKVQIFPEDGPPAGINNLDKTDFALIPFSKPVIEDDFAVTPWGLFSLAAQAKRAGHDVRLFNISLFAWDKVRMLIEHLHADLFGISCFTFNRRGVSATAKLIKSIRPKAHVVLGGPHVTPMPAEILEHWEWIDTVVFGEGEETFLELVSRLEEGKMVDGIPGLAWRSGGGTETGPARKRIKNIDGLASPLDSFSTRTILTSRGCPGNCTFCASPKLWGKRLVFHSVGYVLDMLEKSVRRYGHRFVLIKDDTFTANRKRALDICRGILERKLNFVWSCDTRVDCLDEELLRAMRLAGCQRLSFGVESGSPMILENIKKRITPETVLEATRMAKKFGFQIRYYMMVGNRGETLETLRESRELIEKAKPNQYVFSTLSVDPGTEEFEILRRAGKVSAEDYFTGDFCSLMVCNSGSLAERDEITGWVRKHSGLREFWDYGVDEHREILERLPNLHAAWLDMGKALCNAGRPDEAERYVRRAGEMDYPMGFVYNYLAIIAASRKDWENMGAYLEKSVGVYPHRVANENIRRKRKWLEEGGPSTGLPPDLIANHDFEMSMKKVQPEMPGPIELSVRKS